MKQPGNMLKQLAALQQRMDAVRKEIGAAVFEGKAANGLVVVTMTGEGAVTRVALDKSLESEDFETIGDLVVIASKDAYAQKELLSKEKLSKIAGGMLPMGLRIPGMG